MKHTLNKQSKLTMLLLAFVLCFGFSGFAQSLKISGTVSGDGQPLPGVSILEKGTANGVVSDFDGNFEITAKSDGVLIFSYIGYAVQEVPVNGKATIDVSLSEDVSQLEEVVLIGYGAQKKKELTGAVAQVKAESIEQISTSDVGNALQGQVAGVNVTSSSGQPGDNAQILIRGINSVFGSNEPLYVVDGIPQDGNPQLSVAEIETIDVLKDAASAAIYGTRGSAGVILITTKTGKVGKMNIGVRSFYGVQDIQSSVPLMEFEDHQYRTYWTLNFRNGTFQDNSWTSLEQNPSNMTNNTSLMDMLQVDMASIQQHSVNISGGKQGLTYNVSGNYFDQQGSLLNSGLQRLNIRANTRYKKDRWTVSTGIGLRTDEQEFTPWRILLVGYRYQPYQTMLDPNDVELDNSAGTATDNDATRVSYFMSRLKRTEVQNSDNFNFNTRAQYDISDKMNVQARVGFNRTNSLRVRIDPVFNAYDVNGILIPPQQRSGVRNQHSRSTSQTFESIFNYGNDFGYHNLKFTAVASAEKYTSRMFFAEKFDLISNSVTTLNGATLDPNVGTGNGWGQDRENTLIGLLGRVQYNYKEKYFLSASIRQDGSSRFAKENRWIYAPSASAAWVISEEPGFEANFGDTVNFFKLRASYGTTGNQGIQDYSTQPTITVGHDYVFGASQEELVLGAIQRDFKNPLAQWEKKVEQNFGIDVGMFNNKLTITTEVYDGSRTNMLFPVVLPPTVGTSATTGASESVILNIGDMRNYGSEISVNYKHNGKFKWNIGANYSTNKNEITRMSEYNKYSFLGGSQVAPGLPNEDLVTALREGYPAGSFFLIETDGIIRTDEELAEYQQLMPTARLGDLRYVDQLTVDTDGDGIPDAGDNTISQDDRVYKGNGLPEFELGLNFNAEYKRFDFSMIWYAAIGGEIINGSKAYAYKQGTHRDLVHMWTPANPTSNIPTYRTRDHENMRGYTDFWLQDGSFARLKNVTIGYSLPRSFTNKLKINRLRLYLSADNLLTITDYDGFDPEIGGDGLNTRGIDAGVYPISTQYRAGLLLNF